MLLKNYDCYTAEDFEGDAIWFDLSSSLRCLEIALHINCENAGYVFSSYVLTYDDSKYRHPLSKDSRPVSLANPLRDSKSHYSHFYCILDLPSPKRIRYIGKENENADHYLCNKMA